MTTRHFPPRASVQIIFLALLAWVLLPVAGPPPAARACTLFAAAGSSVEGGGTLIVKNRDRTSRKSALRLIVPQHGYRHLALVDADSTSEVAAVAGINEKGLVVVDALPNGPSAGEPDDRAISPTHALLSQCASVDEVLARRDLLAATFPVFAMVADERRIVCIEVAPRGKVAVQVSDRGVLCHTNHYLDPQLGWANREQSDSSETRYRRIRQFLSRQSLPFILEDFLAFSRDRRDGPDNSIYRTGGTPGATRTLATFLVAQPPGGPPRVLVHLANPGEPPSTYRLRLQPSWWAKGLKEKIL